MVDDATPLSRSSDRAHWGGVILSTVLHGIATAAVAAATLGGWPRDPDLPDIIPVELEVAPGTAGNALGPADPPTPPPAARPSDAPAPIAENGHHRPSLPPRPHASNGKPAAASRALEPVSPPPAETASVATTVADRPPPAPRTSVIDDKGSAEPPAKPGNAPQPAAHASMAATSPGAGEDVSEPPAYELGRDQTPAPPYPPAARRRGQEGTVVVRILVVPDGSPTEVEVVQSSGHPLLDEAACETLRRWHLKPARRHGTPVPARIEVPVQFVLQ